MMDMPIGSESRRVPCLCSVSRVVDGIKANVAYRAEKIAPSHQAVRSVQTQVRTRKESQFFKTLKQKAKHIPIEDDIFHA